MTNKQKRKRMGVIAGALALVSITIAIILRATKPASGYCSPIPADILIGSWVICPPVWFFFEWAYLSKGEPEGEFKHSQELARNIWLALVVVLAAILLNKWPFSSD